MVQKGIQCHRDGLVVDFGVERFCSIMYSITVGIHTSALCACVAWRKKKAYIAAKFHGALVHAIGQIADHLHLQKIAFSGGVFQNALLLDMIEHLLTPDYQLFFHRQISPNDENISF